jgi:hypothetical protein
MGHVASMVAASNYHLNIHNNKALKISEHSQQQSIEYFRNNLRGRIPGFRILG